MRIRLIFLTLLILFFISLFFSNLHYAILFSVVKAMLIGVFFMELNRSHKLWFLLYSAVIVSSALIILILS